MSCDLNWDIDKYKEEHESEDHWLLRRNFMEKWKSIYPEERLVCLARAFANIEFMGCRYPPEVMQEIAGMSKEIAKDYRNTRKTKLQRTFVSASDAAEDRARGVKREGGVILDGPPNKTNRIQFVKPGQIIDDQKSDEETESTNAKLETGISTDRTTSEVGYVTDTKPDSEGTQRIRTSEAGYITETKPDLEQQRIRIDYLSEMALVKCLDLRRFTRNMFHTKFGDLVMLVRSWAGKLWNLQSSCQACGLSLEVNYVDNRCTVSIGGIQIAAATGASKQLGRKNVEDQAWQAITRQTVMVVVKEQFISQNDGRISVSDVAGKPRDYEFGTPVETSVASKMMKMMGWKGGGLGAEAQGIAEPIKPHLQMVNRAGLGSMTSDIRQIKRAASDLMRRYIASDCLDLDLVFSSDFSKEERAALHQVAKNAHLMSRSYGQGDDRFLVVKKKLDPFSLVQAVIEKGGNTPKYQVFIPASLDRR